MVVYFYREGRTYVISYFSVWLKNQIISVGLIPVLRITEKFSANIKIKITKLIPVLLACGLRHFGAKKTGFNVLICNFKIREKLSMIRCDKYLFLPLLPSSLVFKCIHIIDLKSEAFAF